MCPNPLPCLSYVFVMACFVAVGKCDSRATRDVYVYFPNVATEFNAAYGHNEVGAINIWHDRRLIKDLLQGSLNTSLVGKSFS